MTALWGRFFNTKTRLDFVELRGPHPIMAQAVDALEELSSDPEVRRLAEKRRLDLVFHEIGLSIHDVERWSERILDAGTLHDVFGE